MKNQRRIKKYSDSLIKVSKQLNHDIKDIFNSLVLFKGLIRKVPELRYLLLSKRIPLDSKLHVINNVFSNYFGKIELEFIFMLLNNGEIKIITDVIDKLHITIQSNSNIIFIDGMTCNHCIDMVTKTLNGLLNVKVLNINLQSGKLELDCSNDAVPSIESSIISLGYKIKKERE